MSKFAWVTLTTNDTYSLGALVLAHSLRRAGTAHQLAVLVTPTVSESMRDRLKDVYNVVQEVNVLDSQDAANLALLSRPELGVTFTKLHCWRLVQFDKCVFLDADTLVLQNCDELFEREELSAAPDVSWPDCFNSGVFVYRPSVDTFGKITDYAVQHGSFDGGDQGLLNQYFADWSTADIKKHLPFVYNVTAYASYCYLPAFKQFRDKIKILHFAGKLKPWLIQFNSESKTASTPSEYAHAHDLVQLWWNIFCDTVHQKLTDNMPAPGIVVFSDKSEKPFQEEQLSLNIMRYINRAVTHIQHHDRDYMDSYQQQQQQPQPQHALRVQEFRDPWADYYEHLDSVDSETAEEANYPAALPETAAESISECTAAAYRTDNSAIILEPQTTAKTLNEDSIDVNSNEICTQLSEHYALEQHHHQHNLPEHPVHNQTVVVESTTNHQSQEAAADVAELPAHINLVAHTQAEDEAGLAGALSQLRLGAQRTPEQEQYENLIRRQCWESGQVDYSGADSFDNIWKKISQTLETKPTKEETDKTDNTLNLYNQLLTQSAIKLLQQTQTKADASEKSTAVATVATSSVPVVAASASSTPITTTNNARTNAQRSAAPQQQTATTSQPQPQQQAQHIVQSSGKNSRQRAQQLLTSADIEDGKIVYDKATGASTQYKLIEGGYEVITTTPQPNGTIKTQVQTFWDPKPVSEADMAKEQENKKLIKKRLGKEVRIDKNTTMLTRAIEGGYEEVYTTVNDDGTRSMRTKTFFDSVPTEINENTSTKTNKNKMITRKSSVDSTDSTESSRRVVQKVKQQKNVVSNVSDNQTNYREDTTVEETRRVSQNIEFTENNRTVRKNSLQEQSMKSITSTDGGKKKKKTKSSAPPPPADFVQNDSTTVASKRVPGGVEYTYSTELESGKTITTSKTVYEEEEVELTEEEIKQYKKTLKEAEKHKNITTAKKLRSESGTKKVVPSENPGDVTTVETIKIQGGTEYHYTTVTPEGIVKKAVKTLYDPVPCSNPDDTDEEEIIEEYEEEIIEPGEKNVRTIETIKQLPKKYEEEVTITHEKKEKKVKKSMVISQ